MLSVSSTDQVFRQLLGCPSVLPKASGDRKTTSSETTVNTVFLVTLISELPPITSTLFTNLLKTVRGRILTSMEHRSYMGGSPGPSIVPVALLLLFLSPHSLGEETYQLAEERDVEILRTLPHNSSSFTQGLEVQGKSIFESSGLYGHSRLSEIDSQNGEVIRQVSIDDSYFGEGITVKDQSIIMLTWREGVALEFDISNFTIIGNFSFEGEGWGLCYNGEHMVTSNGTSELSFRDPINFETNFTVLVTWDGNPVSNLNELECVDDKIYANVWMEDIILEISSTSGAVKSYASLISISSSQGNSSEEVLNGIAFDQNSEGFWITGKNWTEMYLVNFTISKVILSPDESSGFPISVAALGATIVSAILLFRITLTRKEPETPNFKDSHR
ncbi:MAG TPA: hypothetical protein EYQ11_01575 [Candidatus Poseidoniales archaeon]|nr:MAG: hypothetical protein CXT66_05370 [Euryarchaeota archaeon]HIG33559.1 hypothetical protein [Candidatus Poseidoniales archaeon]HIL67681.1 hypothetical protein [Candidatus Poseidoniales archaeon]